jgi:hypothetical protein
VLSFDGAYPQRVFAQEGRQPGLSLDTVAAKLKSNKTYISKMVISGF